MTTTHEDGSCASRNLADEDAFDARAICIRSATMLGAQTAAATALAMIVIWLTR